MTAKHEQEKVERERTGGHRAFDRLALSGSYALFFVLSFVYLWLVVEPNLIYHGFGTLLPDAPHFATGWSFLRDSLSLPGGPVIYLSGLLSQGYYYAWLGAGIIVLAGFCLAELSRRHLVAAGLAHAFILAPFPAIMLFLIYSQYNHPLSVCLAVLLGLFLSLILQRLPLRRPPARSAACFLLAVAGLWAGGAGTLLVFALMTLVEEVLVHRRWATIAVALPASVVVSWLLAEYVFLIPVREVWLTLTPFVSSATAGMDPFLRVLVFLLYGFAPLAVSLVSIGRSLFGGHGSKSNIASQRPLRKEKHAATRRKRPSLAIFTKAALSALPVVAMALGLYLSHKELRKPYVLSNYYARQKQWDKILDLSRRLPKGKSNAFVNHDLLRALYHTGRLPYDMFCYPLVPEALLLTHEDKQSDLTQWKLSDIFLELGHVNMAQKLASELLATRGPLGMTLDKLAWTSIIKGRPDTARVYLNALRKDPIYHRQAESLLHGLDSGFTPEQTAYVTTIRSYVSDDTARLTGTEAVDETLAALLAHNPRNKMAFEYLMACYLLTGQVDKIVQNAPRLRDLGYQKTPTLYEEAMMIYFGSQGHEVDLSKFNISPETFRRYETFVQLGNAMQSQNRQAVLNRMISEFGTSYFFYYTFGRVGLL